MTESQHVAILRRKMRAPAAPRRPTGAEDVVRRLIPRIVEEDFGVEARLAALEEREAGISRTLDGLDVMPLMLGLGPEGAAPRAIAIADAGLVAAVIEMETTRAVSTIRRDPRLPTPVDVALVGRVIARWIGAMRDAAGPEFLPEAGHVRHFVDKRAVLIAFDDGPARGVGFDFDFGDGRRRGGLKVVVPLARPDAVRERAAPGIAGQVGDVTVPLRAVLCRERIALQRLRSLAPGDILELGGATVRRITLETDGGMRISAARLGQSKGRRALRLAGQGAEGDPTHPVHEGVLSAIPEAGSSAEAGPALQSPADPVQAALQTLPVSPSDEAGGAPSLADGDLPPLPVDLLPEDAPAPLPPL